MNCKNQTVFIGDNLPILRGLNSGIADLIATDPPWNKERRFNHLFGTNPKDKKGREKPGFDDAWTLDDVKEEEHELLNSQHPDIYHLCSLARKMHGAGMMAYLIMMSTRMLECHRILKETGSLYLHCDPTANSYLRLLLDAIFGQKNFRNEIIWHYSAGHHPKTDFKRKHDVILRYAKKHKQMKFNQMRMPYFFRTEAEKDREFKFRDEFGRIYRGNRTVDKWGNPRRFYLDEGTPVDTVWTYLREKEMNSLSSSGNERTGWSTQKPVALYSRMIEASTDAGDLVLDPFCGCSTTLVAAENAGRKWIGIDRDENAEAMVKGQLGKLTSQTPEFWRDKVTIRKCFGRHNEWPVRDDLGKIPHYKKHFDRLYREQSGICPGCNWHRDAHVMTVDHDYPKSKGGRDNIENLRALCSGCNSAKGTKTLAQLIAKNKKNGVWNDGLYGRETPIDATNRKLK